MARIVEVTELALRDAHQSLMATRMAMEDMIRACEDIDQAGYWSVECWGGATFDACIRFLNDTAVPTYIPPHGLATTLQTVTSSVLGAEEPPVDGGKIVCGSPVAGVVMRLNVQPGQQVQTHDLIMVLEAMKMETNITAPLAGKITKINVA
jgi:pyruvate carboxylase